MSKSLSKNVPSKKCFALVPTQMLSLRHLALDAHIDTGVKYDGSNTVIEDVIFEVDQLRDHLEDDIDDLQEEFKVLQKTKNSKVRQDFSPRFWRIIDEISRELFEEFSYSEMITTDCEVEWKEYFHHVYDAVVPEDRQPYNNLVWTILPKPPHDLDDTYRCWPVIKSIRGKFSILEAEAIKASTSLDVLKFQVQLGKEMVSIKNQIVHKSKALATCYRIIDWSMC